MFFQRGLATPSPLPAAQVFACWNAEHEVVIREMSVREANQNFSQGIAAAEAGETIMITKNGSPVARITPQAADRAADPTWANAHKALAQSLSRPRAPVSVGDITEDDLGSR